MEGNRSYRGRNPAQLYSLWDGVPASTRSTEIESGGYGGKSGGESDARGSSGGAEIGN